jgi:hypothetical protein
MPFKYTKIHNGSVVQSDDTLELQQSDAERGRSTLWTKTSERFKVFRWPVTLVSLFVILMCELAILRKQHLPLSISGEINGLVPSCKSPATRGI